MELQTGGISRAASWMCIDTKSERSSFTWTSPVCRSKHSTHKLHWHDKNYDVMYALKPVRPTSYLAAWTTRRGLQINYECIISTCINLSQKKKILEKMFSGKKIVWKKKFWEKKFSEKFFSGKKNLQKNCFWKKICLGFLPRWYTMAKTHFVPLCARRLLRNAETVLR